VITGAHLMLFSPDAEADRAFLRDVLQLPYVRAGGADDPWLIFGLPPTELGVHPTDGAASLTMYLMCDDVATTVEVLSARGVRFTGEPQDQGWGIVTALLLPSGAEVGLYQPRHSTAHGG
jgi:catechol 2,3-dioxygenase-like lactoylglutathione lyase family enzyme